MKKDNNIFDDLKQNLDKNNVGEYQTEIKLTKFKNKKLTNELKNFIEYLVKSRLLCKMLYNVFTISTYQN